MGAGLPEGGTGPSLYSPPGVNASAPASAQKTILFFPILSTFYRFAC